MVFTSFGDMLRVPGSDGDLLRVKARGGDVRAVYSPLDALELARRQPDKEVVFFAVEVEDLVNVREMLTPRVAKALPGIVERVMEESRAMD